jgi:hypothetical protein
MQKSNLLLQTLFMLVTFIMFSCASNETANSDKVSQSEIYQIYSISYNAGDMELSARATFRFGGSNGTTLLLVKPSIVKFNNEEMPMEQGSFSGTYYEINKQSDFIKNASFHYINNDKKSYDNKISMEPIDIVNFTSKLDTTQSYTLTWNGLPVGNAETVTLVIEDKDFHNISVSSSIVGANSLSFSSSELKGLTKGAANIYISRNANFSLKEGTHLGGSIYYTYTSKKVGIII